MVRPLLMAPRRSRPARRGRAGYRGRRAPAECDSPRRCQGRPPRARPPGARSARGRGSCPETSCWRRRGAAGSRDAARVPEARNRASDCSAVLPRSRPASSTMRSAGTPATSAPLGPLAEEAGHVGDQVVVVRLGVGHPRLEPNVGDDDGGAVLGRGRRVVGIAQPADVVAHHRALGVGGAGNGGAPGIDGDRRVEAVHQPARRRARPAPSPRPR